MRIAILADLHGNQLALEAVIDALSKIEPAPDMVVVNGDLINGTPMSATVIDLVRSQDWLVIRGNHEFYYLDFGTKRAPAAHADPERWGQLHWLIEQVTPEQGAYLATLPDDRTFYLPDTETLRIAHGVPGQNRTGFYPNQAPELIAAQIDHVPEPNLISAHTHMQIDRFIMRGPQDVSAIDGAKLADENALHRTFRQIEAADNWWHLINPGSVGLPLNGNVDAQFALLDSVPQDKIPGGWKATHFSVPYDRCPVLEAFYTSGMLEAGGIISQLFYWEVCTAEPEIILFYRWSRENGCDPDSDPSRTFQSYMEATGRDQYVRNRDPLVNVVG